LDFNKNNGEMYISTPKCIFPLLPQKEMYISIHKFIVKKRLIQAHHRICAGEAVTVVAMECGFQDYSGFYKQYKKAFGFPPSQKSELGMG
jgi:AraC-like DNA-binding protein